MKTTMKEVFDLACSHGWVWRKYTGKGKLGSPIRSQDFPNFPRQARFWIDRHTDIRGGEQISVVGRMKLKRGTFYLCERSLKSAVDENPLPCAKFLLAQGFNPVDVSTK